jgi:hypothetical protein
VSSASFTARSLAAGSVFFEGSGASRGSCRASAEAEGCEKVWGLAGVAQKDASAAFSSPRVDRRIRSRRRKMNKDQWQSPKQSAENPN